MICAAYIKCQIFFLSTLVFSPFQSFFILVWTIHQCWNGISTQKSNKRAITIRKNVFNCLPHFYQVRSWFGRPLLPEKFDEQKQDFHFAEQHNFCKRSRGIYQDNPRTGSKGVQATHLEISPTQAICIFYPQLPTFCHYSFKLDNVWMWELNHSWSFSEEVGMFRASFLQPLHGNIHDSTSCTFEEFSAPDLSEFTLNIIRFWSWSSGNALPLEREVWSLNSGRVKSDKIVANSSLPLRQFFERSYVTRRRNDTEMGPTNWLGSVYTGSKIVSTRTHYSWF